MSKNRNMFDGAVRIKSMRKAAGLTQEQLARRAGLTLNAITNLEKGRSTDPHLSTLLGIAEALEVSLGRLLEDREEKGA